MKKKDLKPVEQALTLLEHDKQLAVDCMKKTRRIIRSKAGLIKKTQEIDKLHVLFERKQKLSFKKYKPTLAQADKRLKTAAKTADKTKVKKLQQHVRTLKKFYK